MKIKKLLVANRSEIATRIFRSASELGIRTVAIYTFEDRYALHRFKADEAYQVGHEGEPLKNYLNIDEIIHIAKTHHVDAIHPGYGFLSENPELAKACHDNGIIFVGPDEKILRSLGDKVSARKLAEKAKLPTLGGSAAELKSYPDAQKIATKMGYPIIIKAAHGGGGRGMRVVRDAKDLKQQYEEAKAEAAKAFGNDALFIEKFIEQARHIEVQLLGDKHGQLVHLYERDCSVQRRHQKVIEIAPAPNLDSTIRDEMCTAAVKLGNLVGYNNAGTVEFLLDDQTQKYYFIEVNPRIQVEHTVTEEVTGFDIVKAQILIAAGEKLSHPNIEIMGQESISTHGFAIQCRVTTEDPANNFTPDYGKIEHYRSASGMGVRLDAGSAFSGAIVYPFYDSLLVKVTVRGRKFTDVITRMDRSLREFRIRGVKTNIPFVLKVLKHQTFIEGRCTTRFIDKNPDLFVFEERRDRATKILSYLSDIAVNGHELTKNRPVSVRRNKVKRPRYDEASVIQEGTRQHLQSMGAEKFSKWILKQKQVLITDTTMRDAHQSLLATRMRSHDLIKIADAYARITPQFFSLEMWGGATFDTSMRFLKESPWERLEKLREACPNILFQMLLRASSAVGYANYPDNLVKAFVQQSADSGIDLFRIFDALNYLPNMKVAMDSANKAGVLCEAAICYSGDILDGSRTKYTLDYYVDLAKRLEDMGAHILAIKDMAGLLKPEAAKLLIKALKSEISLPIHLHTHDTNGMQGAMLLKAIEANVDIVDVAMAPMSGNTSQPNLNALVELLRLDKRATDLEVESVDKIADYWRSVREFYTPFESQSYPATADLYRHEMPGGQYTNLYQQAVALGLSDRWQLVCDMYARVNLMFGDIVKVTPSSKAVGDMALFMVANDLNELDICDEQRNHAIPSSVLDLIGGNMGKPYQGFPKKLQKAILKDTKPLKGRAGNTLEPIDFDKQRKALSAILPKPAQMQDILSHVLYPSVYKDFVTHQGLYSDTSILPTPVFFYGLKVGEEVEVDIEPGKTLFIKMIAVSEPNEGGKRTVFYELNGQAREIVVQDNELINEHSSKPKADPKNFLHIGAQIPGMVVHVFVKVGDKVKKGQKLFGIEAMKMESTLYAQSSGQISKLLVSSGDAIESGDLLLELK